MPSDITFKAANRIHRGLLTISRGRLGWRAGKMPVLEVTTIGRKSGKPRTVILTSPYRDGDTVALVASRGGDDRHPDWFLNMRDNPAVEINTRDGKHTMVARVADPEERAELWVAITERYANYAGYQEKTDREIPVVLLDPAS